MMNKTRLFACNMFPCEQNIDIIIFITLLSSVEICVMQFTLYGTQIKAANTFYYFFIFFSVPFNLKRHDDWAQYISENVQHDSAQNWIHINSFSALSFESFLLVGNGEIVDFGSPAQFILQELLEFLFESFRQIFEGDERNAFLRSIE